MFTYVAHHNILYTHHYVFLVILFIPYGMQGTIKSTTDHNTYLQRFVQKTHEDGSFYGNDNFVDTKE